MFTITITAIPSQSFSNPEPQFLREALTFGGFRTRTGRRARSLYGTTPEVTFASVDRKPATWATREAAERNLTRLTERGYTAEITEA